MIFLVLCGIGFLGIAAALFWNGIKKSNTVTRAILILGITAVIAGGVAFATLSGVSDDLAQTLITDNYELNLYYGPVNNSYNEYVRFDYYTKVKEHNAALRDYIDNCESPVFGSFFKIDKLEGIEQINFSLRADDSIDRPAEEPVTELG